MTENRTMPRKHPTAVLDYEADLFRRGWLKQGELITDATVTPDSTDLTVDRVSFAGGRAVTWWTAGGEAGKSYKLAVWFETNQGRSDVKTVILPVGAS